MRCQRRPAFLAAFLGALFFATAFFATAFFATAFFAIAFLGAAFFAAAFFFDLGFGLFYFLFNLYLTDLHFNERAIGNITASLTLGNVVATVPAILLARRYGLRPLLLFSFVCAPGLCALRVLMRRGVMRLSERDACRI